jgi:tetratricopeptide (TPR) repeat protein
MIDLALKEFEAGNFREARVHFQQAHQIFPNARTLRALGKTEYELKNLPTAISYLEQALQATARPLTPPQRAELEELIASARSQVARYVFLPVPADALLMIDGEPARLDDRNSVVLVAGDHFLEARASGYHSQGRRLHVVGKVNATIGIELRPVTVDAPETQAAADLPVEASAPTLPAPAEPPPRKKRWLLWTGIAGVVVAGAAVGLALGLRDPEQQDASGGSTGIVIPVPPAAGRSN